MIAADGTRRETPQALRRALWAAALLLVAIGAGAAASRALNPGDALTQFEPLRQWTMDALHREDPLAAQRPAELARIEERFANHSSLILLHVVPGGLFLLLAPLQFSTSVRTRYRQLHRWSGRILLSGLLISVVPALYFGVLIPYAGGGEALVITVFGVALLVAMVRAFVAIRRRQIALHREWMIRVFAFAVGISTVRVAAAVIDILFAPSGIHPTTLFVASLWTGWILTAGAAEFWIRYTRPRRQLERANEIKHAHHDRAVGKRAAAG